ncbi:MAG TPA: hypothetical protein VGH22_14620 [Candidatus Binatia bacterium]|jgi:hypothetical protein
MRSLFLGVVLSLLFGVPAAAAPLAVGYSSVTSVFLPFWIGNEAGFYKKDLSDESKKLILRDNCIDFYSLKLSK